MLKMTCQGESAIAECNEWLTSGSEGLVCEFAFDQDWNGLSKTAVFLAGNVQCDVVLTGESCVVPGEVLANPHCDLFIGVYGTNAGGTVVIPTIYANIGRICEGSDPTGDETVNPHQPVWAQIQGAMGDLSELQTEEKSTLVAAINEAAQSGGSGGGISTAQLTSAVNAALTQAKESGEFDGADGAPGQDGASAYEQAAAAGYSGTAAQFAAALAEVGGKQPKAIPDAGGYFTADTVEGALQEIGAELSGINTLIGSGVIS